MRRSGSIEKQSQKKSRYRKIKNERKGRKERDIGSEERDRASEPYALQETNAEWNIMSR